MIKKSLSIILFLFSFTLYAQDNAVISDAIKDACESELRGAASGQIKSDTFESVSNRCTEMPLANDLSIQTLAMIIGRPFYHVLEAFTGFTGVEHGMDEDSEYFTKIESLHAVIGAFNWFLFYAMSFLIGAGLVTQILHWQSSSFEVDIKKWLNREGVSKGISIFLTMPVIGWMTPLQFIAVLFIVFVAYVAKIAVFYLFMAGFVSETVSAVAQDLTPQMNAHIAETVIVHKCDVEVRDQIMSGLMEYHKTDEMGAYQAISSSPLYNCLTQSTVQSSFIKMDKMTAVNTYVYTPASIIQTRQCLASNASEIREKRLSDPSDGVYSLDDLCGRISINIEDNTLGSEDEMANSYKEIILSNDIELKQRQIAVASFNYQCRDKQNVNNSEINGCYSWELNNDTYSISEDLNPYSGEKTFSRNQGFMSDETKSDEQQAIRSAAKEIGILISNEREKIFNIVRSLVSGDGNSDLGVSDASYSDLVSRMEKGVWTGGALFLGGVSKNKEDIGINESLQNLLTVSNGGFTPKHLPQNFTYMGIEELGRVVAGKTLENTTTDTITKTITKPIIPSVGLYYDTRNCWKDQSFCFQSAFNPFVAISDSGSDMLGLAAPTTVVLGVIYYLARGNGDKIAGGERSRSITQLSGYLYTISFLYGVLGLIMMFVIPAYPVFTLMVMLGNWLIDVFREIIGLQISMCVSVISGDKGKQVLNNDARASMARIFALALYLLFIIVGMIVMFLMFSFLFAFNVLVVGAVIQVTGWHPGADISLLGITLKAILDIIIVFLLYRQVRDCSAYMEKLPREIAGYFGVSISDSKSLVDEGMSKMGPNRMAGWMKMPSSR